MRRNKLYTAIHEALHGPRATERADFEGWVVAWCSLKEEAAQAWTGGWPYPPLPPRFVSA